MTQFPNQPSPLRSSAADAASGQPVVVRRFHPPGWSRPATAEDVATARRILPMHAPTDSQRGICASALHLINAPSWPCEQYLWAKSVLDAAARREIS